MNCPKCECLNCGEKCHCSNCDRTSFMVTSCQKNWEGFEMSIKLYNLAENYNNLWGLIEQEDMDLAVLEEALKTVEGAIQEKGQSMAIFIQSLGAEAEAIKAEEKRLADRRRALENKQTWLKQYLQGQMEFAGLDKIKTTTHTISLQSNPPSVNVIEERGIPEKYWKSQDPVLDKRVVLEDLKAGVEVVGCELKQSRSIRIR